MSERRLEWATFIEDLNERRFQSLIVGYSFSDPWVDPYETYHSSQDIPHGGNVTGWRNPTADALLETMRGEFDSVQRTAMFHKFNHIFHAEQPITLLVHQPIAVLINKRFKGVEVRPSGLQDRTFWVEE